MEMQLGDLISHKDLEIMGLLRLMELMVVLHMAVLRPGKLNSSNLMVGI